MTEDHDNASVHDPEARRDDPARPRAVALVTRVEFLNDSDSTARTRWLALWRAWPGREVQAHPDYGRLFAHPTDQVVCAALCTRAGGVLLPLILCPLGREAWAGAEFRGRCDAISPYGYGGPYAWNVDEHDSRSFWPQVHEWLAARGAVSLFLRLSLFPGQTLAFDGDERAFGQHVVRTLGLPEEELWRDYAHKVRKNVAKARRSGLTVIVDPQGERLEEFLSIYYATMDRRSAQPWYYFSRESFETMRRALDGQYAFFHVVHEGRVVSTELVLVSAEHIYSFLGGSLPEAFDHRPNDLLKHAVIEWGSRAGKKAFVMGGGYSPDDGVFRYKLSFAPRGGVPFRGGTRVYDGEAYWRLIEQRRMWEKERGREWHPRPVFFPEYRA